MRGNIKRNLEPPKDILDIAKELGLFKKTRKRPIIDQRAYLYLILAKRGYNYTEIGIYFNKDHATILNALRHIDTKLNEEQFNQNVAYLMSEFPLAEQKKVYYNYYYKKNLEDIRGNNRIYAIKFKQDVLDKIYEYRDNLPKSQTTKETIIELINKGLEKIEL